MRSDLFLLVFSGKRAIAVLFGALLVVASQYLFPEHYLLFTALSSFMSGFYISTRPV